MERGAPVMVQAASEQRKTARAPMLSGVVNWGMGCFSVSMAWATSSAGRSSDWARRSIWAWTRGVRTHPGQMAFTVMPVSASSMAPTLVRPTRPCLAATVGGFAGAGDEAVGGGDVDDAAPAAGGHGGDGGLHGEERGGEVERDDGVPAVGGEVGDGGGVLDAGVVDEDVEVAEFGFGAVDEGGDGGRVEEVGLVVEGADALGLDGLEEAVDQGLVAEAVEHDVRALGGEGAGDAEADAAG